ncbi:MAG: ABC transporter substrate-binding protein [Actinomycetes bacterium]|jgi:polar amino acid transport system substrate-binding protein|nr:ABC transporter substrate-binding protein [Actinomycetes bacterium]
MKKKLLLIGLAVLMVVAAGIWAGCSAKTVEDEATEANTTTNEEVEATTPTYTTIEAGVLTIGSDCDYPPFIQLDGEQPAGFEFDLMTAIGEEMGLTIKYLSPQNFDSILASVDQGTKMDIGVSSFTITPERQELVDFCDPYFDSNQACVAMKDAGYTKAADLDGKKVGAQSGTTGADWVKENLPNAELVEYTQTSEALAALQAGKIEAAFFDEPVAAEQVATTYTDAAIIEAIPTGEQYGFAVSKNNTGLRDAVNQALQTVKDNGKYKEIFAKYFDFEPTL